MRWAIASGKDFREDLLPQIGEYSTLRYYDLANRTRHRLTGQVDVVPNEQWTLSVSTTLGKEDYDDSYFGLQESRSRVFTLAADYRHPTGFGAGASYTYERYAGFQRSRSASPGVQQEDPARDWTTDSTERVNFFSIYASPPPMGRAEARISYDYAYSHGDYLYGLAPGSPLTPPSQLPRVFNKLQELRTDIRYRLTNKLAATVTYLYEPFRVYDFAFDPQRDRRHHPAQLARAGIRLPSLHRARGEGRRDLVLLNGGRTHAEDVHRDGDDDGDGAGDDGVHGGGHDGGGHERSRRPGRGADQARTGGLCRAEMPDVPLDRGQGRQGEPARRRRRQAVGRGHQALDHASGGDDGKTKSTKKPPMPGKYASLPAADLDALVAYMQSLK